MDEVDLSGAEQEGLRGKSAGTAGHGIFITASLSVRDLHLLDGIPDIGLKRIQEGRIQVVVNVTVLIVVDFGAVPLLVCIDVLYQESSAVTATIVYGRRNSLVYHNKISWCTVYVQRYNVPNFQISNFSSHAKNLPIHPRHPGPHLSQRCYHAVDTGVNLCQLADYAANACV